MYFFHYVYACGSSNNSQVVEDTNSSSSEASTILTSSSQIINAANNLNQDGDKDGNYLTSAIHNDKLYVVVGAP